MSVPVTIHNSAMPLKPNQKLGAYEVVCSLGAGGMGEVYRARDSRLGRDVALKVLPPEVTNEAGRLERFDREARAIAALNHPHIVTIYSTEEADGIRFLTMELVDGCTLSDLVISTGMEVPRFLDIAIPLADALAAAHQKQITHRDLKPGNVMVSSDGRVKVLDFGLARVGGADVAEQTLIETLAPITQQGTIVGTMPYMSPEQIEGRTIDARSDLFSLGIIFYELLSGQRPFKGGSSPALMSAILRDTPPPIADGRNDIPDAIERLVSRLLEKRPEDRVQTARDVFNELKHVRKQVESGSPRSSVSSRAVAAVGVRSSLSVATFVARSTDDDSKALAEALTDDVRSGLSKFGNLRVLAGSAQGARYVIEGQVRRSGNLIRVSSSLTDSQSGEHLWTEQLDRDVAAGIFALQDDISNRIVAAIGDPAGVLTRSIAAAAADRPYDQLSVLDLVARYHVYTERFRADEHLRLREAFERVQEREPLSAEAWAALSMLYWQEHTSKYNPLPDAVGRQKRAAERALEVDPHNQQAWLAMASSHRYARDQAAVRAAVERAVRVNPLNPDGLAHGGLHLAGAGDYDRALELTKRAADLKPHHPGWYHLTTFCAYFAKGEYAEALREVKQISNSQIAVVPIAAAAAAGFLDRPADIRPAIDAIKANNPALLDPRAARDAWAMRLLDESLLDRIEEGFRRALQAIEGGDISSTISALKPPSSTSGSGVTLSSSISAPSIAVLPFVDLSEKKDQDWFCDGIAEELLNALATLPGLRVAARASAFSFKGKSDDLRAIGEKLNVTNVLEGSVRRAGDRVRITAQMSHAREGRQIWSERFDREIKDIFDVQEEIARAIADRLRITIAEGSSRLVQQGTTNMEAYALLLQGRAFITRRGRAILEAVPLFERAIALDPNLAEAHALLGDAYRLIGLYGLARASDAMPKARTCVERALAIDPNQAEALATHSILASVYDWNLDEMIRRSDRMLTVDPNHVRALAERAISMCCFFSADTDWQMVTRLIAKARTIDPLNAWLVAMDGFVCMLMGRAQAIAHTERAIELDGNNFTAHWIHTAALAEFGREDESLAASIPALAMSGRHTMILTHVAAIHSARGDLGAVEAIRAELRERAETAFIGYAARAVVAAAAEQWDEARELLGKGIAERDPYVPFWKMYAWRPVWKDERCAEMIRATSLFVRGRT